ncbi:PqqD family peptide modification chaperone [Actinoplanes sp. NPDC051861]|uniref:PqqD family peptide modification chaperone n=1 Tax=Actinoplanes sp. NPDC051861 TaxID=3155170 RepID=UPI003418E6F6
MAITLSPGVVVKQVGEESIVLGAGRNAAYWRLNATANAMLASLLDGKGVDEIAADIAADTAADVSAVRVDVDAFVRSLLESGLAQESR